MNATDLSKHFLLWFQKEYPDARIYRNNTGVAWYPAGNGKSRPVAYGIPLPVIGRGKNKKKKGGGGPDFIAFVKKINVHENGFVENILTAEFYEVKTKKDKMSKVQKDFSNQIVKMGGNYYIVHEIKEKRTSWKDQCFYLEKWGVKE